MWNNKILPIYCGQPVTLCRPSLLEQLTSFRSPRRIAAIQLSWGNSSMELIYRYKPYLAVLYEYIH